jgi:hypothetical protein
MAAEEPPTLRRALRDAARLREEARRRLDEADLHLGRVAEEAIRSGMRVSEVGEAAGLEPARVYASLRRLGARP